MTVFCRSVTQPYPTLCSRLWTAAHQASLSFTVSWSLLKFMSIESVMPSNHLILRHPLLLLPSVFPSVRVISSELALSIRWPKYWGFSFNISPSGEFLGCIWVCICMYGCICNSWSNLFLMSMCTPEPIIVVLSCHL